MWATQKEHQLGIWLFKTLAALGFIITALECGALTSTYGIIIFVGLILCLGGDVLLIPKSNSIFLMGIGSFLLGHVAFAIAFANAGTDMKANLISAVPMGIISIIVLKWLGPHLDGLMKKAVPAYILAITIMVVLAIGCAIEHNAPWVAIGAIGFMLSDLSVARERFVASGFVNKIWGTPLYFGAQVIIAMTTTHGVIKALQ
jgi:uncharacterized membrane protein YhhN